MITISTLLSLIATPVLSKEVKVTSPNGEIKVTFSDEQDQLSYNVEFNNQSVIDDSALGLVFKEQAAFADGFKITKVEKSFNYSKWEQPWGERRVVEDNHNEVIISAVNAELNNAIYSIRARVFDDGIGFRYEVPKQDNYKQVEIVKELTEFTLADAQNSKAFWIPARGWNRYEYVYNETPVYEAQHVHTPVTFKTSNNVHLSIHEAALVDYAAMTLNQRRPGKYIADLTPWYDGIAVKTQTSFKSPWRTIQIADDATGLLNSDLILNLNEPNKLGDVSWVNPGKYVGIWWEMHINKAAWGTTDPNAPHGATTENTKKYIDFAAKYGFDGVLVEGWNEGWDGDWFFNGDVFSFTKNYPDFDIKQLADYGAKKGVKLIGHHETSGNVTNYRNQMQDALDLYQDLGVEQIKTGYVADGGNIKRIDDKGIVRKEWHDGQFMVNEYLFNIEEAAKRKISINTHEPVKDTGLRRTYPNWITREGARGQEFNAWGTPPNPPEHIPMLAFTRMLSGPMDFTPGIFDMGFRDQNFQQNGQGAKINRPQTTLAKQLASYVVLYSPIQMAADLPENYEAKMDAFQFIRDVPTDWEQSIALDGEVGDFVVFARKERKTERYSGHDWYLGAITNEDAREIEVSLDFLESGKRFEAQIYRDGDKANWINNPYDYFIEKKPVTSEDVLTLKLATSGGTAIRFKALN
ncbi:MAG: glycoside hydrolase family 97 protein [Gammaproteobacteria bacterium]|nr:glycoside hydrolase family 97 protein [Gammaproteobacteria bacterium]